MSSAAPTFEANIFPYTVRVTSRLSLGSLWRATGDLLMGARGDKLHYLEPLGAMLANAQKCHAAKTVCRTGTGGSES